MRGVRIGLGRAEWIENVDERPERLTPYTEVFIARPWRPHLKSRFCFTADDTQSLEQKSAFSTHPFHLSDTIAQIMLSMSPDASVVLVDDSIWSIFSQEISEKAQEVPPDPLTFSGLRRASFGDFAIMLDEIFGLFDVIESQGVLKLVRNSKEAVTKDTWFMKFWLWVTGRRRCQASNAFKKLLSQGQFHIETNHWVTPNNGNDE
jgi:hypothetical protein